MVIKVLYLTLNHKGGMIHYVNQLINNLPAEIEPLLITGMIDSKGLNSNCSKFSLKKRDIVFDYLKISQMISSFSPDIIHITSGHYLLIPILRKFSETPIIVTLHDVTPHIGENNTITRFIINYFLKSAQHIFVHGSIQKKELLNRGVSSEIVTVIPHGDYSFFENDIVQEVKEENAILFFGRILEYKGLNYLIDAMVEIQDILPTKLIIAGNGDISPYMEKIRKLDAEHIEIHNYFIPDEQVAGFFQRSKVIILPYIEASQTGIIPIAYSFKKPVIATDVGALSEVVVDGETGYLIEPKNTEMLKKAVIDLVTNDSKRKMMGTNAYTKMKEDLSWDNVILKTLTIYKSLLHEDI